LVESKAISITDACAMQIHELASVAPGGVRELLGHLEQYESNSHTDVVEGTSAVPCSGSARAEANGCALENAGELPNAQLYPALPSQIQRRLGRG
jgi:hypothetical protein